MQLGHTNTYIPSCPINMHPAKSRVERSQGRRVQVLGTYLPYRSGFDKVRGGLVS
jgi:hypothetical protein